MQNMLNFAVYLPYMYPPDQLIQDIQIRLDRMVRQYQSLLDHHKQLETENKQLAKRLKEAEQHLESVRKQLDTNHQEILRDAKGLTQWKNETRREIKGIMKEVEKCLPQVESLMENKAG